LVQLIPDVMNVSVELAAAGRAVFAEAALTLNTAIPPTRAKMTAPRVRRWKSIADLPAGCIHPLPRLSDRDGSPVMPSPSSSSSAGAIPPPRCTPRSVRPGGIWGSRALLSVAGAATAGARAVADTAGTFVVAWEDSTTQTLNVLTSPPGGGFAPAATFPGVLALGDLKIARVMRC
jgi:hypothetical protein